MNRTEIMARLINISVPFLNIFRNPEEWPYSMSELSQMDKGTLGRELFDFLNSRELGYLPKYEVHDAYHTLLGYGTTVLDELKLQAFMWGNKNSTFAGRILFILGLLVFPSNYEIFQTEINRGKKANPLKMYPIADLLNRQLTLIRNELCIS